MKLSTKAAEAPFSDQLTNSALRIFRGFARLFVGRMSFDVMMDLLTRAVVEEARRRVAKENRGRVVQSQVALLSGVPIKQIKQAVRPNLDYDDASLTVEARILAAWANDQRYRDNQTGKPMDLLIHGTGRTFQGLISSIAGRGVTTQTVITRLQANGNVEIVNEHWLRLLNPHWKFLLPIENEMIDIGTFNAENLLRTMTWNIDHNDQPDNKRIERGVWSISLDESKAPLLRQRLREALLRFYEDCAHTIREHEHVDPQTTPDEQRTLIGVNLFYWERGQIDDDFIRRRQGEKANERT
ncbi:MAG: hypothetical protein Tsb002_19200 [Wenzhouxiangellaceae bacterium]